MGLGSAAYTLLVRDRWWQTIVVLALPTLIRTWPTIQQRLSRKPNATPDESTKEVSTADLLRHGLAAFAVTALVCDLIFSDPSLSNPFTLTRLHLTAAPAVLAQAVDHHYRARGRPTPFRQQRLLQRLSSLDARTQFAKLGDAPLLECSWCRSNSIDQNAFALILIAAQYAFLLLGVGVLTSTGSRGRWRSYLVVGAAAGFAYDAFDTLSTHAIRSDGTIPMSHDSLCRLRHGLFVALLAAAWWAPSAPQPTGLRDRERAVAAALTATSRALDVSVGQTQTAGLQRQAIMQTRSLREPACDFFRVLEIQNDLIRENPEVGRMRELVKPRFTSSPPS